ncbi:Phosphoribosyl-ATP pyrophosphatase [Paraliobacillus sp. PM-2]|uniref:bifunctional phosphoribosyl-AMP cyclohydrolase/phosphoribosyl-ATP diphosphatase HisIE n=1 Tax=Paraliobacillus sp. PM-2 TaxID=1462524 RepID=UPI00061BB003|nr:bifunctional phosphoribosyl-AMP cyclohydrolase/phosphoribosyl-ATP diphosphatase HisIE [Paraliobacillus sp. PM-2]CQR47575.1 Phosphoribosyl-ATP pyrophosphatase [Paraliobacillus sp. PM-2]
MNPDFSKGLLPAIVMDANTKEVLMLAYMNEESYQKTLETKQTWFYSRSRKTLWHKGATSGNTQQVVSISLDCDQDSILIYVNPNGPACHTGETSCFFNQVYQQKGKSVKNDWNVMEEMMTEIQERKEHPIENSYTNYLFTKGIDKISKKVIEEAGEVVLAAKNQDPEEVVLEVSDLIYHTFVLMSEQNVSLNQVKNELARRTLKKGNSKGDRPEIKEW